MEQAKLIIEVVAGLIPEQPEPEFTKRWVITSTEWEKAVNETRAAAPDADIHAAHTLLAERNGEALGYAALLMLNIDRLNWVRTDWIWL